MISSHHRVRIKATTPPKTNSSVLSVRNCRQLGNPRVQLIQQAPEGRFDAGSPRLLTGTTPVVAVRLPATTSSSSVSLRSEPRLAADSSSASVPVDPCQALFERTNPCTP